MKLEDLPDGVSILVDANVHLSLFWDLIGMPSVSLEV